MATEIEMAREAGLPLPHQISDSDVQKVFSPYQSSHEMYDSYVKLWESKQGAQALWQSLDEEAKQETKELKELVTSDLAFIKQLQFYHQIAAISPELADLLFQKTRKKFIFSPREFQFDWPLKASKGRTVERVEELVELLKGLRSLSEPEDQQAMAQNILSFIQTHFEGFQSNLIKFNAMLTCLTENVARSSNKEKQGEKDKWEKRLGPTHHALASLLTREGIPAPDRALTKEEIFTFSRLEALPSDKIMTFLQGLGINTDQIPFIKKTLKRIKQHLFFKTIQQVDPTIATWLFAAEVKGAHIVLKRALKGTDKNTASCIRELAKRLQNNPDPNEIVLFIQSHFVFMQKGKTSPFSDISEVQQLKQLINLVGLKKLLDELTFFKNNIENALLYLHTLNSEEKRTTDTYLKINQTYLSILRYETALAQAQSVLNAIPSNDPNQLAMAAQLKSLSESNSEKRFVEYALQCIQKAGYLLSIDPKKGSLHTPAHIDAKQLKTKGGIDLSELCAVFRDSKMTEDERLNELKKKGVKVKSGHPSVLCIDSLGRKVFFKFNKRGAHDALTSPLEAAISQVYRDDLGNQAPEVCAVYDQEGPVGVISVAVPGFHDFVELQEVQKLLTALEKESAPNALTENVLIEKLTQILENEEKRDTASIALDLFQTGQMTIQEFKKAMTAKGHVKMGLAGPAVVSHIHQEDDNHLGNGGMAWLRNEKGQLIDRAGKVIPLDEKGKPIRKPVYTIIRIDFDMSFWEVLATTGVQKRTEAFGTVPTFPLDIFNLIHFPQVHDGGWYGFSRYHSVLSNLPGEGSKKRQKEQGDIGTSAYKALQDDPDFRREKWKTFLRSALKPDQLFQDALLKHLNGDNPELLSVANEMSAFAENRRQKLEDQLVKIPEFWAFMEQDEKGTELEEIIQTLKARGIPQGYFSSYTAAYQRIKAKCIKEKDSAKETTKKFIRRLPESNPVLRVLKQKLQAGKSAWVIKKDVTSKEMDELVTQVIAIPETALLHQALWNAGIYLTLKEASSFKQELLLSLINNSELRQHLKARKITLKNLGFLLTGRSSTRSVIENELNPALAKGPQAVHEALKKLGVTISISELEQLLTLIQKRPSQPPEFPEALDEPAPVTTSVAWQKIITTSEIMESLDLLFEPQPQTIPTLKQDVSTAESMPTEWSLFEKVEKKQKEQKVILISNDKIQVNFPQASQSLLEEGEEEELTITPTAPIGPKKPPRKIVYSYRKNQSEICVPDSKGDVIYRAVVALRKLHLNKTGSELKSLILDATVLMDKKWKTPRGRADIIRQIELAGINRRNIIIPKSLLPMTAPSDDGSSRGRKGGG